MDQSDLFNTARLRVNSQCAIINVQEAQLVCGYFIGKPSEGPCKRCGGTYQQHYPELRRSRRVRAVVAAVCDVCSYPMDSAST